MTWKDAINHPIAWVSGAVTSVWLVTQSLLFDPTGAGVALIQLIIENISTLFTTFSIAGFTVIPEIAPQYARIFRYAAILFGIVFVLILVSQLWDKLEERLV